jgi:hypothetical protein
MADDTSESQKAQPRQQALDIEGQAQPRQQALDIEGQAQRPQQGMAGELADFMLHNKKWWLTPIIAVLMLAGLLVVLGGTGAAPFIYTLF